MNAYVDQNFLINCINCEGWKATAARASNAGLIRLVLSPWNIYEIGSAPIKKGEEMLAIVDELQPFWILERVDLQLREFVVAWSDFWNGKRSRFDPIRRTFNEVQTSFLRGYSEIIEDYRIRDFAAVWGQKDARQEAEFALRRQTSINASNRLAFEGGKLTDGATRKIRERYIARQFAIAGGIRLPDGEIHRREDLILSNKKLWTPISFFVEFGGMDSMMAHRVEESLVHNQWKTTAELNSNRQIDKFHATVALPYCDLFVTSDAELIRKSNAIRRGLDFEIAEVITGEDFIDRLRCVK